MSQHNKTIRIIFLSVLLSIGIATGVKAQEIQRTQPKFWIGVSGAANFNFYTGTTQTLNSSVKSPTAFHDGFGVRPYGSFLMEYRPNSVLGFMMNFGYDDRSAQFDDVLAPCNCPATLRTRLKYLTAEPSIRIAPFSNGFYVFLGGIVSYNIANSFTYSQEIKPELNKFNTTEGDFSDTKKVLIGGQVGLGYDILLSNQNDKTQVSISPFAAYIPYFGQSPRSSESWSISTARAGIAIKFGRGKELPLILKTEVLPTVVETKTPDVSLEVKTPKPLPNLHLVREILPLRNYIFFNQGNTNIPTRYILLTKEKATAFRETQLQDCEKNSGSRSSRQLTVYYNILNIMGDRMRMNPTSNILLIGSSAGNGPEIGLANANSAKAYLVNIFGIDPSRIKTEGRSEPLLPSVKAGATQELDLLKEGDNRVDIVSTSSELMLLVKGTSPLCLKPVEVKARDKTKTNEQVSVDVVGAKEAFKSWSVEITDQNNKKQNFGPFTSEHENISAEGLLIDNSAGTYKLVMTGETKTGKKITKESTFNLSREKDNDIEELRYSILFEFDNSNSVILYEKFLKEIVAPAIPANSKVIISGHSDKIGAEAYNLKLSKERAYDAQKNLEIGLLSLGTNGVVFETTGYGEDFTTAPFDNILPEERFYNRTVLIDIVPNK